VIRIRYYKQWSKWAGCTSIWICKVPSLFLVYWNSDLQGYTANNPFTVHTTWCTVHFNTGKSKVALKKFWWRTNNWIYQNMRFKFKSLFKVTIIWINENVQFGLQINQQTVVGHFYSACWWTSWLSGQFLARINCNLVSLGCGLRHFTLIFRCSGV